MKTISGKYDAESYIKDKEEFITRSRTFRGYWKEDTYYIQSYNTVIAQFSDGVWIVNDYHYSMETGQQWNVITRALGWRFIQDETIHVFLKGLYNIQDLRRYLKLGKAGEMRIARLRKESSSV